MLIVLADLAYGAELGVRCNRELDGLRAGFGRDERRSGQALGATPGRTWGEHVTGQVRGFRGVAFRPDRVVGLRRNPARLWRRVLLERVAYRLLTCDRSVLEVAVEAGYSCHEVFTRACQRGEAAAWRAAPRQIQLGARTGCTSADGQAVAACRAKVPAMDLLTRMAGHHVWLAGEVIGRARRLPAAGLDKPFEVPVDEDRQTLLSAGRPDGDVELRDRQPPCGWSAEEHEDLDVMRGRLARAGPAFPGGVDAVVLAL